ncbi:T9SS C-terminal target domain-containing protein [Paludibacter sp. 221]|uniref:polysaccharide lyase family 8 super-sandwich domain-containing protein n=1 Tax=Paludibacter sp. 221 TaxID=2302939 RepID=UPI0013D3B388|nr:polysaccharide lyase family 8 super-sandwich domain-containing protein [Paludibacter sp. 221]NDV46803.1 T9SS C-terminal target domain-containing protein [Paludibacter sp. 221]
MKKASLIFIIPLLMISINAFSQSNDISLLREKWTKLLIGDGNLDTNDPTVLAYINDVNDKAMVVWNSMVKKPTGTDTRTHIFSDLPMTSKDRTGTSQITFTYDRLKTLALAYKLPKTTFTGRSDVFNEIIAALDMMVTKYYSVENATPGTGTSSSGTYGNWYDWRIGTPLRYNDLLFMLADELSEQQITNYMAPVLANNKAVDTTGANRTWIAGIVAQAGILLGREDLLTMAKDGLKGIFKYVTSGDGYYVDGSFVQHTSYAYTGGYGKALLCTISPLMYILKGSDWEISYSDNVEQIFYDMVFMAYEPLIYNGRFMDMVREREISRLANQDHVPGRQAIRAMILLLDVLKGEQKERAEKMVKEWLKDEEVLAQVCSEPNDGFLEYALSVGMLTKSLDIAKNKAITPRGDLILHHRYSSMDRIVHLRENYALGLAMTSTRIKNTEGTNDEGLRLWHIGDGMTYLYNEDKDLFADNFWATVDYQRLPGTTVTRSTRGTKDAYGTNNPYAWVGGTNFDDCGVAGMQFKGMGTGTARALDAKKSWFMFDDEIVALGSNIKLESGSAPVETIIENRKIKPDLSNTLTMNGNVMTLSGGGSSTVVDNKILKTTTIASSNASVVAQYTFSTTVGGIVTFEYDIKLPTASNFMAVRIYGKGSGDSTDKLLNFSTMREGILAQRTNASGDAKDACSTNAGVTANQWHHVKIVLDMANGKYNYYFDGNHITACTALSGNSNTVTADLTDRAFIQSLSGSNGKLTYFDIVTPKGGVGTIILDNIKVTSGNTVVYEENFEDKQEGNVSNLSDWSVTQTDNNAGAGSIVYKDKETIPGEPVQDSFTALHNNVEWIHLEGSKGAKTDIGYYFPGKATVRGLRETRTGSWHLVNTYFKFIDTEPRTNSFATFWFEHGNSPQNESYAYVLLPGKSANETKAYNKNPDIEILQQDESIHAVRENKLQITGINFWTAGKFENYTVNIPASLMIRNNNDNTTDISISNPAQSSSTLYLDLANTSYEVVSLGTGVTSQFNAGNIRFTINTANARGKSFYIKLKLKSNDLEQINKDTSIRIYPNPAKQNELIYVEIDDISENEYIKFYNLKGELVMQERIEQKRTKLNIAIAQGTYIAQYKDYKTKIVVK